MKSSRQSCGLGEIGLVSAILAIAPMGIAWHEIVGHGLVGVLCGGRLVRLQCLGVQIIPALAWTGIDEGLGAADVTDIPTHARESITQLAGSVSTLAAAVVALAALQISRAGGLPRLALTCVGVWALDLLTFTLPSLGWKRYVVWGTNYSEPAEAAVALGIPAALFQTLAIGGSLAVFMAFFVPLRRRQAAPPTHLTSDSNGIRSPEGRGSAARGVTELVAHATVPQRRFRVTQLRLIAGAVALAVLAGAGTVWRGVAVAQSSPPPLATWQRDPATRVSDWQVDIDALAAELPKRHKNAFFKCKREDFQTAAAALREAVPRLRDHEVVVGLMKLAALIGDAHTGVSMSELRPPFHQFPLSVYVFSDGPVIVAARESQKDLIGTTVLQFAGIPIDEAFCSAIVASAFENKPTFKDKAPRLLLVAEIASAVGLIPTTDTAVIVVRDAQGSERTAQLTPLGPGEPLATLATDASRLPLSRQKRPHANWFELVPDRKALYFRYNTCADEADLTVAKLSGEIAAAIDANNVQRLIVDLRGNSGGNSALLQPFIWSLKLRSAINSPGGVVVLIGRYTFSSAHMHAMELKERLGATLIGEPTGQKPNAYGEVRWFALPRSQITIRYSTKFWKLEDGDRPSLDPDVLVELSSADYFAMKDPPLEAALDYVATK